MDGVRAAFYDVPNDVEYLNGTGSSICVPPRERSGTASKTKWDRHLQDSSRSGSSLLYLVLFPAGRAAHYAAAGRGLSSGAGLSVHGVRTRGRPPAHYANAVETKGTPSYHVENKSKPAVRIPYTWKSLILKAQFPVPNWDETKSLTECDLEHMNGIRSN